jgi:hypothetical protein
MAGAVAAAAKDASEEFPEGPFVPASPAVEVTAASVGRAGVAISAVFGDPSTGGAPDAPTDAAETEASLMPTGGRTMSGAGATTAIAVLASGKGAAEAGACVPSLAVFFSFGEAGFGRVLSGAETAVFERAGTGAAGPWAAWDSASVKLDAPP